MKIKNIFVKIKENYNAFMLWLFTTVSKSSGVAYIVRNGKLHTPNGELVKEYDGNDLHNFPKWEPYKPSQK